MTPESVGNILIVLGIPVMLLRLFVGFGYGLRSHRVWTFGLNGAALLVLFIRIAIQRNTEGLIHPQDWVSVATWGLLVGAQVVAVAYGWWPHRHRPRRKSHAADD